MKRIIIMLAITLVVVTGVYAGTYTINTTAEQDVILNEASVFYGFPVNAIIEDYKLRAIADLKPKMEKEKRKAIMLKYDTLTAAQKAQVDTLMRPIFQSSTTIP